MQNEKFIKLTKKYQYRKSKLKYINKIINLCKQYMKIDYLILEPIYDFKHHMYTYDIFL